MKKLPSSQASARVLRETSPRFEELLPAIRRIAEFAFRRVSRSDRSEFVASAISKAYEMYVRLVEQGKAALAYSSALANYAVRQVLDGRRTGNQRNVRDVFSRTAQRKQLFRVMPISAEELTDDRKTDPAELAALRIDFAAWLKGLSSFKGQIALHLAVGHSTNEAARRFGISAARVSQIRVELCVAWHRFQGMQLV